MEGSSLEGGEMKPRIEVSAHGLFSLSVPARLVFVFDDRKLPPGLKGRERELVNDEMQRQGFRGGRGETLAVTLGEGRRRWPLLLAGLGKRADWSSERLRLAAAAGARLAQRLKLGVVGVALPAEDWPQAGPASKAEALTAALLLGNYRFDRYFSDPSARKAPVQRWIVGAGEHARAAREGAIRGQVVAEAVALARDLVNEPAEVMTPAAFARAAAKAARGARIRARLLLPREIQRQRMGALLAVARGSDQPPRVVHLIYRPQGKPRARLALVGKGVTYDSGGFSLKSTENMLDMKSDMAGAAAVLGALLALARLKVPLEIHGVIGLAENLLSARSYKLGDVLRTRRGKTVEINNTDAEGRLLLADLLDFVRTVVKPEAIVDVATLTGACVVALGPLCTGVLSNRPALGEQLTAAAGRAGEKFWPLPLFDEYLEQLKSPIADLRNTGNRYGGTITAALFLREFVEAATPWAHLDIAGPAFLDKDHPYWGKGATGAGVAALVEFARSYEKTR